jgi:hypothetical protein
MTQHSQDDPAALSPTEAFEALRGEVAHLETSIKGLTAKREELPNYSPTLAAILRAQKDATDALHRVEQSPAIKLSPAAMVVELARASEGIRSADREMLHEARDAIVRSVGRIDGMVERGQAADRQFEQNMWWGTGGIVLGAFLMATVPGIIIRALPDSWNMPERMAARSIGLDMASAGERLSRLAEKLDGSEAEAAEAAPTPAEIGRSTRRKPSR